MKRLLSAITILALICLAMACSDNNGENRVQRRRHQSILTPTASGNPYEVMIVADDSIWNGFAGKAIRQVLERPLPMLPQEEPMFHLSHVNKAHYNRITNLFRNIIMLEVDQYTKQAHFELQHDLFSAPQLIMSIKGPSHQQISSFITEQTQYLIKYLSTEELNREATILEDQHNPKFSKAAQEMFGCDIYVPLDLNKIKKGDNFLWASNDGVNTIQNIVVYSYPYATERVFTRSAFIALRDTFMKRNIPGYKPNQYMTTTHDFVQVKNINVQGHYVQEARGLWEMANDMMGGPFISHSQVDTINNRVIVAEGFVYAPSKMKRSMIRRLEAALYTLKLPTTKIESNEKD